MEWIERWIEDGTMVTIYIAIAALGGGILVLQLVLQLFGFGDADGDVGDTGDFDLEDIDGDGGVSILSVRAMAGFLAFFGLTGWYGTNEGWSVGTIVLVSLGVGLAVAVAVGYLISLQRKLQSKGNVDPRRAVGKTANVYLRVPGQKSGQGKIQVAVQGRTAEYIAITAGPELPTGSEVRVVRMTVPGTFEVTSLNDEQEQA